MLRPPSPAGSGPAPAKIRRVMTPRPSTPGGGGAAGCGRMLTRSGAVNPCSVLDPSNPIFLLLLARRGGCAKTTTALNLAFALANRGYNVLLPDMDPQCDATRFLLHDKLEKDFDGDYSAMISRAHCTGGIGGDRCRTLYEAMAPLLLTHDHPQYVIEPYEIQTPAGAKVTGKIFLIAGHEETVELEQKMATAEESWQSPALAALSKPHDVFKETAVRHGCSFILIDTNPFSGTLNCNLWHSSDYFLIPCGADNASMHGIRALTDLILKPGPGWLNRQRSNLHNFATRQAFLATQGAHISPFPDKEPKFLGIVLGNYIAHHLNSNNFKQGLANDYPSTAFFGVMTQEAEEAQGAMVRFRTDPVLQGRRLAVDGAIFAQVNLVEGLLGRVRSFRSLNMMAQQSGVPVAFLQYRHLSYQDEMGNPVRVANPGDALHRVDFFKRNYDQIVWNILALIHKDSGRVAMPEDWTDRKMGGPGEGNFFNEVIPPGQDFELDLELIDELEVEVVVED